MGTLEKGITSNGAGYAGKKWNILGQVYYPKATCDAAFAFETNSHLQAGDWTKKIPTPFRNDLIGRTAVKTYKNP